MIGSLTMYSNMARTVNSGFWFSFFLKTWVMVHQTLVKDAMLTTDPTIKPMVTGRLSKKRDPAMSSSAMITDKKKYF